MYFSYLAVQLGAYCANGVSEAPSPPGARPRPCSTRLPLPWSWPRPPWQNELTMTSRFLWALGVYAALALMAAFTLDGKLRAAVWVLLGGLTVKTCIAYKAGW